MRILQSITYYLPYVSGITIYALRLGEKLAEKGYEVKVLTSGYSQELQSNEAKAGVKIKRVQVFGRISKGPLMPGWFSAAWQEAGRADVVLIHLPQFEGLLTALAAKLRGKSLLAVYHCEVTMDDNKVAKTAGTVLKLSQFFTCWLANKIVVYTDDYARSSKVISNFLQKTVQIYPPVELPKQAKQLAVSKGDNERWVGFSGRVSREKGIEYLIEAFRQVRDIIPRAKLVIAGGKPVGEERYFGKIEQLTEKFGNGIIRLGEISQSELVDFYLKVDVLVLPSINSTEAFGLVQVEAMLCGTPVVATDLPGVRVPVRETGMGEVVPPRSSRELANAILKVLTSPGQYLRSPAEIKKIFSLEETLKGYERLFYNLQK